MNTVPPIKWGPFEFYRMPLALALEAFGDGLENAKPEELTWEQWERQTRKRYPLQFFVRYTCYNWIRAKFRHMKWRWYEVRDFFFPKNVIKIKTLSRSVHDELTLVEHGLFQILSDFMAQNPEEIVDFEWEYDKNVGLTEDEWNARFDPSREKWRKLKAAYAWWEARGEREKLIQEAYDLAESRRGQPYKVKYAELNTREKQFDDEMTMHLRNIVECRDILWI